jgi:hypothetical protein
MRSDSPDSEGRRMKSTKLANELFAFIRRALKADAGATICVGAMVTKADGTRGLSWAMANSADPGEMAEFADTLLASAAKAIANGRHPDCDNCRQNIVRIEAARAALGVETRERTS